MMATDGLNGLLVICLMGAVTLLTRFGGVGAYRHSGACGRRGGYGGENGVTGDSSSDAGRASAHASHSSRHFGSCRLALPDVTVFPFNRGGC